jgi:hypothetical protein
VADLQSCGGHGGIEDYLRDDLNDGWQVVHLHEIGGAAEALNASGWLAVVLEK